MWEECVLKISRTVKCLNNSFVQIERNCDNWEGAQFVHPTQPRPLWSALEANIPFPRLEHFIKIAKNIVETLFEASHTFNFKTSIPLTFEFQTCFVQLYLCPIAIPKDVESLCRASGKLVTLRCNRRNNEICHCYNL